MGSDNKRLFSGRSNQRLKRPLSACLTVQQLRTTDLMVNPASHQDAHAPTIPAVCATMLGQISNVQRQNPIIRLDQLRLLFEAGNLMAAEIVPAPLEPGPAPRWSCQFRRRNGATVTLDLNRKRQGAEVVRIFNSLDAAFSACQAVGFRAVTVHQN